MTDGENWATPEIVRFITRIDSNVTQLQVDLKAQGHNYVSRGEFVAWREGIGRELGDIKGDITKIENENARKTPSWWTIVALVISGAAALAVILPPLASAAA